MRFFEMQTTLVCLAAFSLTAVVQAATRGNDDKSAVYTHTSTYTERPRTSPLACYETQQPQIARRRRQTIEDIDPAFTSSDAANEWRRKRAHAAKMAEEGRPSRSREQQRRPHAKSHRSSASAFNIAPLQKEVHDAHFLMFEMDDIPKEEDTSSSSSSGDSAETADSSSLQFDRRPSFNSDYSPKREARSLVGYGRKTPSPRIDYRPLAPIGRTDKSPRRSTVSAGQTGPQTFQMRRPVLSYEPWMDQMDALRIDEREPQK